MDIAATRGRIQTYIQMVVLVMVLWDVLRTRAALQAALQMYILGSYVCIVGAIINYRDAVEGSATRYAASGFHPNDMGLILALGLPVAWHLAIFAKHNAGLHFLRIVNFAYLPAAVAAILLTASRGTVVAASPMVLFLLASLMGIRPRARIAVFGVVIGALLAVIPFVPQSSWVRLSTIPESITQGDMNDRIDIWLEGVDIAAAHPILGVGSGAYRTAAVETKHVAHNVFVSVMCELGLIGFLLMMAIILICYHSALQHPKPLAWLWITVLLIWSLGALVHTWEQRKQTWFFLSIVVVSSELCIARHQPRRFLAEKTDVSFQT
jgi:O-antigen ligase